MKAILVLVVACVALCQAQNPLKFKGVLEGASKVKDAVEKAVNSGKVNSIVEDIVNKVGGDALEDGKGNKPKFCNGLDCPPFDVKEKTKDYEMREYPESHWVQTVLSNINYKEAQYTMFMKLFHYISGQNADKKKIAMTCPVIMRIIPGQGPACENNFTMAFYVSPSEGTPPQPTDPTVSLIKLPLLQAYAQSFGGYASMDKNIEHAKNMGEALKKAGKKFEDSFFYTAGYDAPFKLFNRHNEVWFLAA